MKLFGCKTPQTKVKRIIVKHKVKYRIIRYWNPKKCEYWYGLQEWKKPRTYQVGVYSNMPEWTTKATSYDLENRWSHESWGNKNATYYNIKIKDHECVAWDIRYIRQ